MFTLRIFLIDLIAFVPQAGGLWSLLPDARNGGTRADGTPIDPHFPVALFDTGEENGGDWSEEVKDRLGLGEGDRFSRLWFLENEELRFVSPDQLSTDPVIVGDAPPPGVLPTTANREDFAWAPRMQSIVSGAATVDPACLAEKVTTPKIIARMHAPTGRLRILRFAGVRGRGNRSAQVRAFEFKVNAADPAVGPARAIADAAVLEVRVLADAVDIEGASFDGTRSRKFTVKPSGRARIANMLLGNLSPLNLSANESSGPHFDLYYNLLESPPADRPIPFISATGGTARAIDINTRKTPDLLMQIAQVRLGGISRQICTSPVLSA